MSMDTLIKEYLNNRDKLRENDRLDREFREQLFGKSQIDDKKTRRKWEANINAWGHLMAKRNTILRKLREHLDEIPNS